MLALWPVRATGHAPGGDGIVLVDDGGCLGSRFDMASTEYGRPMTEDRRSVTVEDGSQLRERIEALPEMVGEPNVYGASLVRRSDVLAALPATEPDAGGLDVERLEQAFRNADFMIVHRRSGRQAVYLDLAAERIASEYAALRAALSTEREPG
jgi:LPS sulfotransferase NodH